MSQWESRAVAPHEAVQPRYERDAHLRPRRGGHADAAARGADRAQRPRGSHALSPAHRWPGAVRRVRCTSDGSARCRSSPARRCARRSSEGRRRLHPDLPVRHSGAVHRAAASRSTSALLQLSPPDAHGYCTLGTSVDAALAAAADAADRRSPRSTTACRARTATRWCRSSRVARVRPTTAPLHEHPAEPPTAVEDAIGEHVAGAGRGRRDAADGHRRHPRRRPAAAARQARPRRPHRDVLRRRHRPGRGRASITNRLKTRASAGAS